MENEKAIQILHETKIQYENSIADESDQYAVDAHESNTEVVIAINIAIAALERQEIKPSGIIRRIDDLGRVVIPKEIRRQCAIEVGDPLELYMVNDGVLIKKYEKLEG